MIKVGMSFYERGKETNRWDQMPQVPCEGQTVHYSLAGDRSDSRAWNVMHVSWVLEVDSQGHEEWHAEIGLD